MSPHIVWTCGIPAVAVHWSRDRVITPKQTRRINPLSGSLRGRRMASTETAPVEDLSPGYNCCCRNASVNSFFTSLPLARRDFRDVADEAAELFARIAGSTSSKMILALRITPSLTISRVGHSKTRGSFCIDSRVKENGHSTSRSDLDHSMDRTRRLCCSAIILYRTVRRISSKAHRPSREFDKTRGAQCTEIRSV